MRTIKQPEVRKNEILDAAEKLFVEKGFDKTTVNDILGTLGIAKGTFYHYFKSKEEALDGIVRRRITEGLEKAKAVAADKHLSVEEKLLFAVMAQKPQNPVEEKFNAVLNEEGNSLLHQKMLSSIITELSPVLAEIVEEGINRSIFRTDYPRESVEMLLAAALVIFDDAYFNWTGEEQAKRMFAYICAMERTLGAAPGSLAQFATAFG